ncbi:hypothetical protein [Streptomyces lannensis]
MKARVAAAALTAGLVLTGCSSSSGLDNTSAEYQEGWNRAVAFHLPNQQGLKWAIDSCAYGVEYKKDPYPDLNGVSVFMHWDYSDHQRKEFAHGCLDMMRNTSDYKIAQQSWEG